MSFFILFKSKDGDHLSMKIRTRSFTKKMTKENFESENC